MTDQIDGRYLAQEMPKILLYPHLVEPADKRDADGNLTGKRSYQVDFLMDPADPDLEPLRKLTCSLINSAFPDKVATARTWSKQRRHAHLRFSARGAGTRLASAIRSSTARHGRTQAAEKGKPREEQRGKIIFKAQKPETEEGWCD